MDNQVYGFGFDGLKAFDMLQYAVERAGQAEAAYFYIPVNDSAAVQRAQYDILDRLPMGVELEPVEPDNLHITLLYIEHIRDEAIDKIMERLNVIMPVQFEVDVISVGTFPEPEEAPLVLHVNPDVALIRLQWELYNAAFSLKHPVSKFSEPQRYKPHITIANNLIPADTEIPKLAAPFKVPISKFVITRSEYARFYTVHLPVITNDTVLVTRGGEGSGHFGHEGRPEEVGGSLPSGEHAQKPSGDGKGPRTTTGLRSLESIAETFTPPHGATGYKDLESEDYWEWRDAERKRILNAIESGDLQKLWQFTEDEFTGWRDDFDIESLDEVTKAYIFNVIGTRKAMWKTSVSQAIALRLITPEEATEKGYYETGGNEWVDLPETMFHVTTAVDAVLADRLKSRKELAMDSGLGLGGGDDETVSFTESMEVANGIYYSLIEAQNVAAGNKTVQDMVDEAREGANSDRPFIEDFMMFWDREWKTGDPIPKGVQNAIDGIETSSAILGSTLEEFNENPRYESDKGKEWRPSDVSHVRENSEGEKIYTHFDADLSEEEHREVVFEAFKRFSAMREYAGGPLDPLYWSTDVQGLATLDPSQIAIVQVRGEGRGYQMSALGEWRTTTGLATPVTGTVEPGDIFRPKSTQQKEEEEAISEDEILEKFKRDYQKAAARLGIERSVRPSERPPRFGSTLAASGPGVNGKSEKMFDLLFENPDVWPIGLEINVGAPTFDRFIVVEGNQVISASDKEVIGVDVLINLIGDSDVTFSAMDLRGGVPMSTFQGPKEKSTYAVTRSALLQMLRGEPLVVGPLRRPLTLVDGPFVMLDDGDEPVERIKAPEPIEFRDQAPMIGGGYEFVSKGPRHLGVQKKENLRDRIAGILNRFVDGVLQSVGIERHGDHVGQEGREGEQGGSKPGYTHEGGAEEGEKPKKEFSKSERERLEWAISKAGLDKYSESIFTAMENPDFKEMTEGKDYVYISPFRPLGSWAKLPEGAMFFDRMVYSDKPLDHKTLLALELAVISDQARGTLMKELYEGVYGETDTYVFQHPKQDEYRGAIVHPTISADHKEKYPWRATTWNMQGFSGHHVYESLEEALADQARGLGYSKLLSPDIFERIVMSEEFQEGTKRSLVMTRSDEAPEEQEATGTGDAGFDELERLQLADRHKLEVPIDDPGQLYAEILDALGLELPEDETEEEAVKRGGPGSGHFEHEGRPGEVGGSLPRGETAALAAEHIPFDPIEGNWEDQLERLGMEQETIDGVRSITRKEDQQKFKETIREAVEFFENTLGVDVKGDLKIMTDNEVLAMIYWTTIDNWREKISELLTDPEANNEQRTAANEWLAMSDAELWAKKNSNTGGGYSSEHELIYLNEDRLPKPGSKRLNFTLWHELAHQIDDRLGEVWTPRLTKSEGEYMHGDGISYKYEDRVSGAWWRRSLGYDYNQVRNEYFADLMMAYVGSKYYDKEPVFSKRMGYRKLSEKETRHMNQMIEWVKEQAAEKDLLLERAKVKMVEVLLPNGDGTYESVEMPEARAKDLRAHSENVLVTDNPDDFKVIMGLSPYPVERIEVTGIMRRIEVKHYGPGPHPGTGTEQTAHAGDGKRAVGITSAKEGKLSRQVFQDMRDFQSRLAEIKSLKAVSVKPGLGGWEGGREPTWVVEFRGDGAATKLIAETAKSHNQDGVLLLDPCDVPADCSPVVDWHFTDPITPSERDAVEEMMVSSGIGGWTWYKRKGGFASLRAVAVPQWGGEREAHLKAAQRLRKLFDLAGMPHKIEFGEVRVGVMNREGENSYDEFMD